MDDVLVVTTEKNGQTETSIVPSFIGLAEIPAQVLSQLEVGAEVQ